MISNQLDDIAEELDRVDREIEDAKDRHSDLSDRLFDVREKLGVGDGGMKELADLMDALLESDIKPRRFAKLYQAMEAAWRRLGHEQPPRQLWGISA